MRWNLMNRLEHILFDLFPVTLQAQWLMQITILLFCRSNSKSTFVKSSEVQQGLIMG